MLTLDRSRLKRSNSFKCLGIIFDKKLTWKLHIKYLINRCQKSINMMRSISSISWRADKKCMLILYRSFILSMLNYCVEGYDSACVTVKKGLDSVVPGLASVRWWHDTYASMI